MNTKTNFNRVGIAVLALSLAMVACSPLQIAPAGETKTETQSVDAGTATSASVLLEMDAGRMKVGDGAQHLMEADFRYDRPGWQPQIDYAVSGSQGNLVVSQPKAENTLPVGRTVDNEWTVSLNNEMPLDLTIRTGAGEGTLDLSGLNLTRLMVEFGAGNTNLDLSGSWDHDVHATVNGGVGNLSVTLPVNMGVRVNAATGLGNVTTHGLSREGGAYVNEAYGSSPNTFTLDIQAGVGAVELTAP
ncbi:MAG: toast rack family protein [Caldilineales bacterium]